MELRCAIKEHSGIEAEEINYIQDDIVFTGHNGRLYRFKYYPAPTGRNLFTLSALKYLENNHFRNIPYPVCPEPLVYENRTYYLTNQVTGREGNVENMQDVRQCAAALANMHKAAEGFTKQKALSYMNEFNEALGDENKEEDVTKYLRKELGNLPQLYFHRAQELKRYKKIARRNNNYFDYEYIAIADYYCEKAEALCYELEKSGYNELVTFYTLRGTICHKEFAPHNVIFSQKISETGIVDFSSCVIDLPVLDIANLIKRRMRKCGWSAQAANSILGSYTRYRNLTQADINILKIVLEYPQKLWRIVNIYYNSRKTWCEKSCLKKLSEIENEKDGVEAVVKSL